MKQTTDLIHDTKIAPPITSQALSSHDKKRPKRSQKYKQLFSILGSIRDAFIFFDNETRYLYANKEALRIIGKKHKDVVEKKVLDIFTQASDHPLYTKMIEALQKKKKLEYEYFSDTAQKWLHVKFYPSKDGVAVYYIDITEQKKLEQETRETEQKYHLLAEFAPDVIYSVDLDGVIVSLSPAFEKLSGWKTKDWVGKKFTDLIHPDDLSVALERFKAGLKKDIPPYELRILTKSGEYKTGEFHTKRNVKNGEVIGKVGVVRDITEHQSLFHELDTRLQQQSAVTELSLMALRGTEFSTLLHRAVQLIVDNLNVGFVEVLESIPGKEKLIFRAAAGWGDNVKVNKTVLSSNDKSHAGMTTVRKHPIVVTNLAKEKRFTSSLLMKCHIVSGMTVPIYKGKSVYGVLGVHTTESREFTKHDVDFLQSVANIIAMALQNTHNDIEIRQREKLFRLLIEYSLDAIRLVDRDGKVNYITPSIRKILGYTPSEYKKMNVFDIMHPDDIPKYDAVLKACIKNPAKPYKLIYRLRHKDGTWRWMEGVGRSLLDVPGVEAVVSNFREITANLKMQKDLELINERLKLAVSMAQLARWSIDLQTNHIDIGKRSARILGILRSHDLTTEKLRNHIVLEDRKRYVKAFEQAIQKHSRLDAEFRMVTTKGTVRWIWVMGKALYEDDKPVRFDVVGLDITSSKEKDERKDEFISMASHELKTPITSLQIFVQLLERQLASDEQASVAVRKVRGQTDRLKEIINDLLDVSRIETGKMKLGKERFYIDELIDDTIAGLKGTAVQHDLILEGRSHTKVFADRFRIYQVLVNLITNAIKYSPQADKVVINSHIQGKNVVVSIQDFGIGVPKTHQKQIFEKLYQVTTGRQRPQSGLGMGLYISKEIIQAHGGSIWVESPARNRQGEAGERTGKGSIFSFSLPIASNQ